MKEDTTAIERELRELKGRMAALDFLLVSLAAHLRPLAPVMPGLVDSAFDSAANSAESVSLARGREAACSAVALRHIENLRAIVAGPPRPRPES